MPNKVACWRVAKQSVMGAASGGNVGDVKNLRTSLMDFFPMVKCAESLWFWGYAFAGVREGPLLLKAEALGPQITGHAWSACCVIYEGPLM